jgi:hypothetical protein
MGGIDAMSSFAGYCYWCEKPVMHKTLFGTLHLCLTDEEKALKVRLQQQGSGLVGNRLQKLTQGLAGQPYAPKKEKI